MKKPGPLRTRRLVSLLLALVAGIIWVLSTLANISNTWDPLNFVLRVAAGVVTVAAAAEWLVLTVRDRRRPEVLRDDPWPAERPEAPEADREGPTGETWAADARPAGEGVGGDGSTLPEVSADRDAFGGPDVPAAPDAYRGSDAFAGPDALAGPDAHAAPDAYLSGAHTGPDVHAASDAYVAPDAPEDREPDVPVDRVVRGPAVPRSAGSTVLRGVLARFGRKRTPDHDLAVVVGGGAVRVVAYLMERKVRRVTLRVGLDPESLADLAAVLGDAPHRVFGTQAPERGLFDRSAHTQIEGASGSGAWSIAVRSEDVELVRYVLARAAEFR